jgi:hypothetical protein
MPSTYSPLKIELPATGEQSGTWGNTTNTNLGTALEEAITGSANVTFASGNVVLTLTDTNASQVARNLRLNLIGVTGGSTRTLTVPAIKKLYLVSNNCADSVIVGNSTGATVTVPAGNNIFVYNDGTDVLNAITYITNLNAVAVSAGSVTTTQVDIVSQGDLRLQDTTGGQFVALQAPGTIATSYTLTLPVDDGTNGQALITDGNGVLSWSTAASGDVYGPASATDNAIARFDLTTGKIIQNSSALVDDAGNVLAGAGLVGAPAFSTTGDTNTGIFFPAADTIAFAEGGVEAMRIDSSANVGIGTNSPTSRLQINYTTSGTSEVSFLRSIDSTTGLGFDIRGDGTAARNINFYVNPDGSGFVKTLTAGATFFTVLTSGVERMRIDPSGFVGINNAAPVYNLDVATSASNGIRLNATTGQGNIILQQAGTTNGFINVSGGPGTDIVIAATRFLNLNGGTNGTIFNANGSQRMYLDSVGNLGIGTSSPNAPLTFAGTVGKKINFYQSSDYSIGVEGNELRIASGATSGGGGAGVTFYSGGYSGTERMRINADGNVGIGTTTQTSRLGFGAYIPANGQTINLFENGNTRSGLGIVSGVFRHYTDSGSVQSFGQVSTADGSTYTERMRIDSTGNVLTGGLTSAPAQADPNSTAGQIVALNTKRELRWASTNASIYGGSGGLDDNLYYHSGLSHVFRTGNTERVRITASGSVGIGTTGIGGQLDVIGLTQCRSDLNSGTSTPLKLINDGTTGTVSTKLAFQNGGVVKASINAAVFNNDFMTFNVGSDTERMRINSGGNLLVGTSNPPFQTVSTAGSIVAVGSINSFSGDIGNTTTGNSYTMFTAVRGASYIVNINAANTCSVYLVTCEVSSSAVTNTGLLIQNGANVTNSGTTIRFTNNFGGNLNGVTWSAIRLL